MSYSTVIKSQYQTEIFYLSSVEVTSCGDRIVFYCQSKSVNREGDCCDISLLSYQWREEKFHFPYNWGQAHTLIMITYIITLI